MPDLLPDRKPASREASSRPGESSTAKRAAHRPYWRRRTVPRYWRYRLAPDPLKRTPKGTLQFWTRARRLLWSWWPWAAAFLYAMVHDKWGWAIGTGLMGLISYLIAPTEFAPRFGLDHEFSIDDEEFLPTIAGATGVPFTPGNRIDLLNNGDEFYPAMIDAITEAQLSITIEAYIYWAGDIGLEFARALAARAKEGIKVKILLDAVGSSTIGHEILTMLESGGCQLAWYNPIRWHSLGRFNHRTHRKSLIIDGGVAFTGVRPLQTGFAQNWLQTTGELISGPLYYPPLAGPATGIAVQTIMSSPEMGASTVRTMYYLSIICARRSIFIANPYFLPDETAMDALVEAKKRGVNVRIMVSGIHNDNWLARRNSIRLFGPILKAGIELLEYNKTMLHHKTMVVDSVWATVGTTNFDNRSFAHNEENNVCFYDEDLAGSLEELFLADVAGCDRLTLEGWRRRGIVERAGGVIAAFLQEQT
ncbi:MAG: phospholipase D-like domain-containing protein [Acidobacteriota bacterium]